MTYTQNPFRLIQYYPAADLYRVGEQDRRPVGYYQTLDDAMAARDAHELRRRNHTIQEQHESQESW